MKKGKPRPDNVTFLDGTPQAALQASLKADLESVTVIGKTKDGSYFFESTEKHAADILWLLERFKFCLMDAELGAADE